MGRELHIVLVEPEIPQNTGNIARTCAAIQATLHLVSPMGFTIHERSLRRAAMDYWSLLQWCTHDSIDDFFSVFSPKDCILTSSRGKTVYSEYHYPSRSIVLFGRESTGLDTSLLKDYDSQSVNIPMCKGIRSLNLSNTVAILAYEIHRQWGFTSL